MQVEILKIPMMPSAIGIIGIILELNNLFLVLGCHFHESFHFTCQYHLLHYRSCIGIGNEVYRWNRMCNEEIGHFSLGYTSIFGTHSHGIGTIQCCGVNSLVRLQTQLYTSQRNDELPLGCFWCIKPSGNVFHWKSCESLTFFKILLMALSFEYCFFITSKLLIFRDIRKYSKPFLCDKLNLKL